MGKYPMNFTKKMVFRYLYRIHLYGGLFCSVYLFIAGVSALNFQHQFLPEKGSDTLNYTRNIQFDPALKVDTLAIYIKSQLSIKGYIPYWEFRENPNGAVLFKIERPARTYDVHLNRNSDLIEISEIHYSTGRILRALHYGSTKNELGDPMLDIWAYYSQIAGIIAFLTVVTSIYFWFKKSVKNRSQWVTIVLSGSFSLAYMAYVWLVG